MNGDRSSSPRGKITIELSDDYGFRKQTLNNLYTYARRWVTTVIAIAPLDVKGLLQTYLSEYDDTGAYGHVSLGRSFALRWVRSYRRWTNDCKRLIEPMK